MMETVTDNRSLGTVVVHSVLWFLEMNVSITGNTLVCLAIYRNRRLRTVTNIYVLALAISDLSVATLALPFELTSSILRYWPFGYNFCQFNGFLEYFWSGVTVLTLALTAVNRYFCVVKPQRYPVLFTKRRTVLSILFVVVLSLIHGLVTTLVTPVIYQWHPYSLYCRQSIADARSRELICFVYAGFYGLGPMSSISFGYGNVYLTVKRHSAAVAPSLQGNQSHPAPSAQEIQASRVLFAAVVGYFICWLPYVAILSLEMSFHVSIPVFTISVYTVLARVSACINPIIYGIMNRAMRNEFLKILRCRKWTWESNWFQSSSRLSMGFVSWLWIL